LFPDRLRIALSPTAVTVRRERGWWRKNIHEETVACDAAFGTEPWHGALNAVKTMKAGGRATVVLSNHFVRYALVPWSTGLDNAAEEEAYVRHHFAAIHGERAKSWALRWDSGGAGARLASAIDRALLEELKQVLPRLVSVQPYLMRAINQWRQAIPKSGAWLALVEADRACIALHAGGRWRSVQNARGAWLDLLDRERHRVEGAVPRLALVAGVKAPAAPGWQFQTLEGGVAH
jgi:hypothetical protein